MKVFKSKLGSLMSDFLEYRVALGYSRRHFQEVLSLLDRYIIFECAHAEELSGELVALRLTCIKAFFAYAADVEPTAVLNAGKISKVEAGKEAKHKLIDYLTEPAIATRWKQRVNRCVATVSRRV